MPDWETQRTTVEQWETRARKFDLLPWEYEKIGLREAEFAFWKELSTSIEDYLNEHDVLEDIRDHDFQDVQE